MEVEGPTDGAVEVGRGEAGMAAAGSTDMGAAGAAVVGREVEGPAGATVTRRRKKQKRVGKKKGGKLRNEAGFRVRRRDQDDGDSGGAGGQAATSP